MRNIITAPTYCTINAIIVAERTTSKNHGSGYGYYGEHNDGDYVTYRYEHCLVYRNGCINAQTKEFCGVETQLTKWTTSDTQIQRHVQKFAQKTGQKELALIAVPSVEFNDRTAMWVVAELNQSYQIAFVCGGNVIAGIISAELGFMKPGTAFINKYLKSETIEAPPTQIANYNQREEMSALAIGINPPIINKNSNKHLPKYDGRGRWKIEPIKGELGTYYKYPKKVGRFTYPTNYWHVEWALEIDPFVAQQLLERDFIPEEQTGYPIAV